MPWRWWSAPAAQLSADPLGGGSETLEHYDILRTLSEVATAFAGFTGIVVALGGRARGEWRPNDKTVVVLLLACSLGVVFFGFIPDLVRAAQLEPAHAWRLSTVLFATYHLGVIIGSMRDRKRALASGEPHFGSGSILPAVFATGLSMIAAQFLTAAGLFPSWLFFFYLLGLLWLLLMSTYLFAVLLLESVSSRPAA